MKRVYPREEICMGCRLCEVHCKAAHAVSQDLIKAFKKESPKPLPLIRVDKLGPVSLSVQCRHCDDPVCVYSCLSGALQKDPETGVVTVDAEKCIGCWTCIIACPFGAIKQDKERKRIAKCDLCQGRPMPACVANCPNEALIFAEEEPEVTLQAV